MDTPGGNWEIVSGVMVNVDDALVMLKVSGCDRHPKDTFCLECLPRLETAIQVARGALDPSGPASVEVEELPTLPAEGGFPEYLALVNPIAKSAYTMKLAVAKKILSTKAILTSKDPFHVIKKPVVVAGYTSESSVRNASFLKAFHVRVGDGLPGDYVEDLLEARFSFTIDGEIMADGPLREFVSQKEVVLKKSDRVCLFHANSVKDKEATDEWLGYMLPNGTRIEALLVGVPGGGGLVRIEVGWSFGTYTTNPEPVEILQVKSA